VNSVAHNALLVAVQLQPGILLDFSIIRLCFSLWNWRHSQRESLLRHLFSL
jgi:hypothetical protein